MVAGDSARGKDFLRVLVVEDDDLTREFIVGTLEEMGCRVEAARDAQEAVSTFLAGEFDLVTLDHRMPGLSGMELHKILSQEFGAGKRTTGFAVKRLCPVVVVTGHAEDPEVARGQFGESIVGVIQKPFIDEALGRVVRDLSEGRRSGRPPAGEGESVRTA